MYILIAFLILLIVSIVAAYFGARYWHWAHVTLLVAIFMATAGFLVLAAETLRIHAVLRSQADRLERELNQVDAHVEALRKGTNDSRVINELAAAEVQVPEEAESIPSIRDLSHKLHLEARLRGPVWRNIAPEGFDPRTDTLRVTLAAPREGAPAGAGISRDSILFLFEQGEPALPDATRGAQYLGEFRVTDVAGPQVTLVAVHQLDDFERQRLARSRGPWALHATMPIDRHDLFDGLSEGELHQLLPEQSVDEYVRHGSPAGPDDESWRQVGVDADGNLLGPDEADQAVRTLYQRRLRDYSVEFDELARRRVTMLADIAAVTKDNERLQAALASARQLGAFREEEKRKLEADLAGVSKERQIVERHLATVQQQLANAQQLLTEALAQNRRLADELADVQARWIQQIDQRSSAVEPEGPLALSAPN